MARYLHFMPIDSPVFNGVLIDLINENLPDALTEHLFLLSGEKNIRELGSRYPNIEPTEPTRAAFLKAAERGEHLILHSLFLSFHDIRHLPDRLFERMTWCVWGHDLYGFPSPRNLIERWKFRRAIRKIGKIEAVAIGFKYDEIEIRRLFGDRLPIYPALYSSGYYREDIDRIVATVPTGPKERLDIMIGHCAFPDFHHHRHLDKLARYRSEKLRIHLFLSYGQGRYRDVVIAHARELFTEDQLEIETGMLSWQEYIARLARMDVAILDFERQAAFGNIILLAYMRKKLYLSPTGIMARALNSEGIPVYDCNRIGEIPFEELGSPAPLYPLENFVAPLLDKQHIIGQWKQLFQSIGH